jgi:hypothetical protein
MKYLSLFIALLTTSLAVGQERSPVGPRDAQDCESYCNDANDSCEVEGYYLDDNSAIFDQPSYHWIFALTSFQDYLEIEDGSIWQIDPYEGYKLRNWLMNDPIMITQNREWFSSFQFRIINKGTGTSVKADLSQGPILDGDYSLQIAHVIHQTGEIVLSDESRWLISSRDFSPFYQFAIGDYIIVGVNSGWDSGCPFILINSNLNRFVRAKQL